MFSQNLVVKEALGIKNVRFQFGDFVPWLAKNNDHFDYIHAAGVLYHTVDPVAVLDAICKATDQVYVWTHYADMAAMPQTDARYVAVEGSHAHGVDYKLYRRQCPTTPSTDPKFCGGVHKDPAWLEKPMILHILHEHGFKIEIAHDEPLHQN
ncbi:hypothetical protein [Mesorhizobium sp. B1-1-8]|uniref:hypothetical protein n=1 Tax=Mesorhizobium sp. B1-1-8 TaxID=2589976 RepID=UPI00112A6975|nr:hypothetical protein [Mesorhizobium sp. B1-1-8]UCI10439.1 class I SAM-dependent methyltransferase [Mesorhizobium sp. B1-1-8]